MRILYITEFNLERPSGVLHKMNEQIDAWVSMGHEVYLVSIPMTIINSEVILLTKKVKGFKIVRSTIASLVRMSGVSNFLNKILTVGDVRKYVDEVRPDIVYFREMIAFPKVTSIFGKNKVVLESNTVLSTELAHASSRLRTMYKLFQKGLYRRCDAFIGVTDEIANQFTSFNKQRTTIANSISIPTGKPTFPNLNKSEAAEVTFVGSPDCPWHGVDKFVDMARLIPRLKFNLVGPRVSTNLTNLTQHGFLNKAELLEVYKKTDVAIGSLALHRNRMEEACPLKVREYLSLGIPVIIAYKDKDIVGQDFVLSLPNEEHAIKEGLEKIQEFIQKWKGKRVPLEMVEPLISTRVKETERLNFLTSIAVNSET